MTDVIKEDSPAIENFDFFPSDAATKQAGIARLQAARQELLEIQSPLELLFRTHDLMTPALEAKQLPNEVSENMRINFMIQDRPDIDRVERESKAAFADVDKLVDKQKSYEEQLRRIYFEVKKNLADRLAKFTHVNFNPGFNGALRSFGSREIEDYPKEPIVYASHTLTMTGQAQEAMIALAPNVLIASDSYYGLSIGLGEVVQQLCDSYEAFNQDDPIVREAYFQVLGTRLIHPFWDGNGRGFSGHLSIALEKLGIKTDFTKIMTASVQLGEIGDTLVETVLEKSGLSVISNSLDHLGHFQMMANPRVRRDYMVKLKTGIEAAIKQAKSPGNKYYELVKRGQQIISDTLQL